MSDNPKEQVYDKQIAPLMTQIIALAKLHKINMFADFSLDDDPEQGPLYCTTVIADSEFGDPTGLKRMMKYRKIAMERPTFAAFTIITEDVKDLS